MEKGTDMSNFSAFMKSNKKQRPNELYAATKSLTDGDGVPLLWELRPVTTRENEAIREQCTTEVQLPASRVCTVSASIPRNTRPS